MAVCTTSRAQVADARAGVATRKSQCDAKTLFAIQSGVRDGERVTLMRCGRRCWPVLGSAGCSRRLAECLAASRGARGSGRTANKKVGGRQKQGFRNCEVCVGSVGKVGCCLDDLRESIPTAPRGPEEDPATQAWLYRTW